MTLKQGNGPHDSWDSGSQNRSAGLPYKSQKIANTHIEPILSIPNSGTGTNPRNSPKTSSINRGNNRSATRGSARGGIKLKQKEENARLLKEQNYEQKDFNQFYYSKPHKNRKAEDAQNANKNKERYQNDYDQRKNKPVKDYENTNYNKNPYGHNKNK